MEKNAGAEESDAAHANQIHRGIFIESQHQDGGNSGQNIDTEILHLGNLGHEEHAEERPRRTANEVHLRSHTGIRCIPTETGYHDFRTDEVRGHVDTHYEEDTQKE